MDVDDDKTVVKEREWESGRQGSEGNLLGHNRHCDVVRPVAHDRGGWINGRQNWLNAVWARSNSVESCEGMISGSRTKSIMDS
jgi:hypothetical protein